MTTFTYRQLQEENRAWVAHNFPGRHAVEPVLGLVEEWGERESAAASGDKDEILDAMADVTVFTADLCNALGLDLQSIVGEAEDKHGSWKEGYPSLVVALGRIAHHSLKKHQGIRGTPEAHVEAIRGELVKMFEIVLSECQRHAAPLLPLVEKTWTEVVKKRDWRPAPTATA